jgi:hypothetical protein
VSLLRARLGGLLLLGVLLVGCRRGDEGCRATLDYQGKTVVGAGAAANRWDARQNACWQYCGEHDVAVDEAYGRWEESGAQAKSDRFANLVEQPSLKRVMEACSARCSADVDRAKAQIVYKGCR